MDTNTDEQLVINRLKGPVNCNDLSDREIIEYANALRVVITFLSYLPPDTTDCASICVKFREMLEDVGNIRYIPYTEELYSELQSAVNKQHRWCING